MRVSVVFFLQKIRGRLTVCRLGIRSRPLLSFKIIIPKTPFLIRKSISSWKSINESLRFSNLDFNKTMI